MESDKALPTGDKETIDFNFALRSIGYKSICADPSLNFDKSEGFIPNKDGKVLTQTGKIDPGLYVAGWLRTGPTGVILTTMSNAFEVAENMCKDFELRKDEDSKSGFEGLGLKNQVVTWKDWQKIDKFEMDEGKKLGKPREKLLDVRKMLEIAG